MGDGAKFDGRLQEKGLVSDMAETDGDETMVKTHSLLMELPATAVPAGRNFA